MKFIRSSIQFIVVVQFIFGSGGLNAQQPVEAAVPSDLNMLRDAIFDFTASQSMLVTNLKSYDEFLLLSLNDADRKALLAKVKELKRFPSFKRIGSSLVSMDGPFRIEIKWPDIRKFQFEVNGQNWDYDPSKPLIPQIDALVSKFPAKKYGFNLLDQLLPSADAAAFLAALAPYAPILYGILGAIVASIPWGDLTGVGWCKVMALLGAVTKLCNDLRNSQKQSLFAGAPKWDASDKKDILGEFEGQTWKCPSEQAKEYHGTLHSVTTKNGQTVATSDPVNVVAKFTAGPKGELIPTDIIFTMKDMDPLKIDEKTQADKLYVHVAYDSTERKPASYRVPNPDYKPMNPLSEPTLSLTRANLLSVPQEQEIERADKMVGYVDYKNYKCVEEKVIADKIAAKASGSPGAAAPPGTDNDPPPATVEKHHHK